MKKGGADQTGQMGGPGRADGFGENVITASGSTSVGMQEDTFDLDYIETELKIEEVYLSSGDEVEEGTPILKLTDESVEAARRELEQKSVQASLDYRQQLLDSEEEKITAKQTYDTSMTKGTYASYTYEESLKEYADTVSYTHLHLRRPCPASIRPAAPDVLPVRPPPCKDSCKGCYKHAGT